MSVKESGNVRCDSLSVLDETVDNVVEDLKSHEEEEQILCQKKQHLDIEIEMQKKIIQQLELQKIEVDAEITTLKLRNAAYQKEHMNLRNNITVIKFQIEKIKESIAKAKASDLKDLEDFENSIDEITEKFRSGPDIYDRRILQEKIRLEKEKKDFLVKKLQEIKNSYANFNKEKGLRARTNENEKLLDCVLPDSESFCFIQMIKTLAEVICQIKKFSNNLMQEIDGSATCGS